MTQLPTREFCDLHRFATARRDAGKYVVLIRREQNRPLAIPRAPSAGRRVAQSGHRSASCRDTLQLPVREKSEVFTVRGPEGVGRAGGSNQGSCADRIDLTHVKLFRTIGTRGDEGNAIAVGRNDDRSRVPAGKVECSAGGRIDRETHQWSAGRVRPPPHHGYAQRNH